ncbi:peptide chain release factor N(5)-glutamine methyltransferase [Pseudonocardia lacus]|uniref:peptide chain release factor N(5)-glutamine methyltransferase n=1 Tax=Pseudonocardia lacus TaxID=2835865 RepID=UPI001BDC5ABA|nr:peptide chain release factor N(5)-glutamine methyltransferase [Pseudonocardia lacus]
MKRRPLRLALMEAERVLAEAGVASPRVDAEVLAASVLGVERGKLLMHPMVEPDVLDELDTLVKRRATREPLQHLLGAATLGPVTVAVGRGVFTPRPETELMVEWGLAQIAGRSRPLVVDLCTGTAAIALAVAARRPDAVVHAVEADAAALTWARRNVAEHVDAGGSPVTLHHADVRRNDLLLELESHVDLVLCNPPYVPDGAVLPPEVTDWDPRAAVFAGPDGLDVIRPVIAASAGLLRYGGAMAIEHDDTHGEVVPALLRRRKVLTDVEEHHDLAGRPRFATARRRTPATS